jgi:hypothetical protein
MMRKSVATLGFVVAAGVTMAAARAEEFKLVCRGFGNYAQGETLRMTVDTTKNTIHLGRDPNEGWYWEHSEAVPDDPPYLAGWKKCNMTKRHFVTIGDDIIEFGYVMHFAEKCGFANDKYQRDTVTSSVLEMDTGVLTYGASYTGKTYQCERARPR